MGARDPDSPDTPRPAQNRSMPGPAVAPRNRPRAWRSVRVRILFPVVLATVGVVVLGIIQVADAITLEQELAATLDHEAMALGIAWRQRTYLVGGLSAGVVAAILIGATVMAAQISRRLRRTRYAALTAARIELPTAISNVIAARDADMVRAALTDSSTRIESMLNAGPDEIGELASAFGAVHRQALRLAADQALLRMEVQAMFVALSRRGQTLIQRQIHLIDEFGRNEADPEALSRLFALDHLAARMRRNEENLLVLAGGEPGRWITQPVSVIDLIRAAAQEIEEYRRVAIREAPAVAVAAHVGGDAIHLLAELLENATSFSKPSTKVNVAARRGHDGLAITVTDTGIGMPGPRLAEANERLARPSAITSTLVGTMGLLVVARLAQRHGIVVRLNSTPAGGCTATVLVPDRLVAPITSVDRLQPGRWLRTADVAADNSPPPAAVTTLPVAAPATLPSPRPPLPEEHLKSGTTGAGLPRRPAEDVSTPQAAIHAPSPATPDPELVRVRLSSLASGIAAANRGDSAPPPNVPPPSDPPTSRPAEATPRNTS